MSWFKETFTSTIGRKIIMAVTGLFLVIFLIGHVSGNMLLFNDDGGEAFNKYAAFMTTNGIVQIVRWLTYFSILFHVIYSIVVTINNKKARPVGYAKSNASSNSTWSSRNMGILGAVILVFLAIHLRTFLYEMKFGDVDMVTYDSTGEVQNLYALVVDAFESPWYTAFYVFSMLFLALHLFHGFQSSFQTVGFRHPKYNKFIRQFGYGFGIIVCLLFAYMPVHIYLNTL
ncbi:MAG: succinate dehydrogenase cytochrome b subunit [Candidatus Cyclobacteriaceae bacterium M3_2C_046]